MSATPFPVDYPTPTNVAEAVAALHETSARMASAAELLLELAEQREENPEMHTVVINDQNNGQYQVRDPASRRFVTKSVGILNPGAAHVYVGVGGQSATLAARVPSLPGASALILPVLVEDLILGCDPSDLGTGTAVVFVFRYRTLQPLVLRQVP